MNYAYVSSIHYQGQISLRITAYVSSNSFRARRERVRALAHALRARIMRGRILFVSREVYYTDEPLAIERSRYIIVVG